MHPPIPTASIRPSARSPRRHAGVAMLTLAVIGGLVAPGGAAAAPAKKEVAVQRITLALVDDSRPTPPNGDYPGAPDRTLETVVSYPKGASRKRPLPLVVFATGYGGTAINYADLYDHWVRAGYLVAAPTFPLSSDGAPGGETVADLANQPGDLSFVLDEVLRESAAKGSKLFGLVDAERVGLAGKSLGAITVFHLLFAPGHTEDRFRAAIPMTGAVSGEADFAGVAIPLLLVHGDADTTVPYTASQDAYARARAPKFLVTIVGGTHGSAFGGGDDPSEVVVERTTLDFFDAYVKGKATKAAVKRLVRDGSVNGVASIEAST